MNITAKLNEVRGKASAEARVQFARDLVNAIGFNIKEITETDLIDDVEGIRLFARAVLDDLRIPERDYCDWGRGIIMHPVFDDKFTDEE